VTSADVAEALETQHGITLDRRKIEMDETIHRLGTYTATADFGHGVTAKFTVEVAPEIAGAHGKAARPAAAAPAEESAPAPEAEPAVAEEEAAPAAAVEEAAEANPS
jgi:hypothetical protein